MRKDKASATENQGEKRDSEAAGPEREASSVFEKELVELRKKAEEFEQVKDTLLRRAADFENAKKRLARESEEMARFAAAKIIAEILPIVGNLARALDHARLERSEKDPLLAGVELTLKQISDFLERNGVQQIEARVGTPFDPHLHEALAHADSPDVPADHIMDIVEAGYRMGERLLRPALVIVSKGKGHPEKPAEGKP